MLDTFSVNAGARRVLEFRRVTPISTNVYAVEKKLKIIYGRIFQKRPASAFVTSVIWCFRQISIQRAIVFISSKIYFAFMIEVIPEILHHVRIMKLDNETIRNKIKARQSFWVGTENERKAAITIAKILGIKYNTGADERGGFYVCHLETVRKPETAK